jgi:hypothetical protein
MTWFIYGEMNTGMNAAITPMYPAITAIPSPAEIRALTSLVTGPEKNRREGANEENGSAQDEPDPGPREAEQGGHDAEPGDRVDPGRRERACVRVPPQCRQVVRIETVEPGDHERAGDGGKERDGRGASTAI